MADVKRIKQLQSFSKQQTQQWQTAERLASTIIGSPLLERAYTDHRTPMIVTTRSWMRSGKYVVLWVNPSQLSWRFPRRESVTKTAAGAIRNTWRNRFRGTYYDEPTLDITFQTGNLMPGANIRQEIFGEREISQNDLVDNTGTRDTRTTNQRVVNGSPYLEQLIQDPPIPPGLQNLYDFMGLIDQPILQGWGENRHILYYRTRVFPRLRVEGYFSPDGISLAESADGANSTTYTAQMQVYRTTPPFWNADQLKMAYSSAIREMGIASELFPAGFNAEAFANTLDYNPFDPTTWDKLLRPESQTKPPALVDKSGNTAVDQKKLVDTTNKETQANFQKTIDAYVKKYDLQEPLKSKFIAEMKKLERQHLGDGSYAPRSTTNEYATMILAANTSAGPVF